jgi:molecular chaperone DnaK
VSGQKQQMKVTPTSGLSGDEIERMIAEAASSADQDRRVKELIGTRGRLESLVRNTQRSFREFGSSMSPDERQAAQNTLSECEELVETEDAGELQRALQRVEMIASQLALAMMNAPAGEGDSDTKDHNERL